MSSRAPEEELPEARSVRSRWPGLIWAVPLAALIIVSYLGVRALFRRGIDVVVVFSRAESVTPGDTKVLVKGVEVGQVKNVRVSHDARHIEVTLSLDPRAKPVLTTATTFWLVGEFPTITDISSVRAAITGVTIEMAPGRGGTPTRRFVGLDQPPAIAPDRAGTPYLLLARELGSVKSGTSIVYRGQEIGKVARTALAGLERFQVVAFIYEPFDRLVRQGAQFWTGSPLKVSLSGSGLSAGLSSPASVLQGSIEFDLPPGARGNPRAPAKSRFILYDDQTSAEQGPPGPAVPYQLVLNGPAGDLDADTRVSLLGYNIGRVQSARLVFAPGSRRPYTTATVVLYPRKLDVDAPDGDWRGATDRAVARLVAQGYRAGLAQSPPLVGPHTIVLARDPRPRRASLGGSGPYPTIPATAGGGDAQALLATANDVLAKVDRMPLERIGANVEQVTASLARLTSSPALASSLRRLDATLGQAEAITRQVNPRVGPLMTKLDQAAGEAQGAAAAAHALLSGEGAAQDQSLPAAVRQLDEAARSIRSLTDYLGRHPEALLRGKSKETP